MGIDKRLFLCYNKITKRKENFEMSNLYCNTTFFIALAIFLPFAGLGSIVKGLTDYFIKKKHDEKESLK